MSSYDWLKNKLVPTEREAYIMDNRKILISHCNVCLAFNRQKLHICFRSKRLHKNRSQGQHESDSIVIDQLLSRRTLQLIVCIIIYSQNTLK